jgi:integrase
MPKPAKARKSKRKAAPDAVSTRRVLTVKFVETRKGKAKEYEVADAGAQGLRLVVQPSGHRSWAVRFRRPDGKPAKLTLGTVLLGDEFKGKPEIGMPLTLSAARLLTAEIQRERSLGTDVISQRKEAKLKQQVQARTDAESTFADFARIYMDEHARPKTRRWIETARNLGLQFNEVEDKREIGGEEDIDRLRRVWPATKDGLASRWSSRPARTIDIAAIKAVIGEAEKGIPGVGVRRKGKSDARKRALRSALSAMFAWLADDQEDREPYLASNPLAGRKGLKPPKARDRFLNDDEIRWFWLACDSADAPRVPKAPRPYGPALRLLLLTGQRLNEIAQMQRHELQNGDLHLAGERTKNGRPHIVPLAPQARDLIPARGDGFVFTTTNGAAPISSWSKTKDRLDEKMLELARKDKGDGFNIVPWRLHDLRRTVVTHMVELGIAPHVIEAVVNHVSGVKAGVAGVYNRSNLLPARREALERWATHVIGLVSGTPANVVSIKEAKPRRARR